jgi:hydrogenase maturation protease
MKSPRVLVAGVGNIFLGDDAFGVEVAARLQSRRPPDEARVVDFGVRGLDLAYALLDGYEAVILVDATQRGGPPGTLYILELDVDATAGTDGPEPSIEGHSLDPVRVFRLVRAMGGEVGRILLVGCEPSPFGESDDMRDGLSEAVCRAVDEAVVVVESLVERLLRGETVENHVMTEETEIWRP